MSSDAALDQTGNWALALEKVTFSYGAGQQGGAQIKDLDLRLAPGERLALLGRSGSGKSTVVRLLLGLERPGAGRVLVGGRLASDETGLVLPPWERDLAVVFQDLALWPHMTVQGQLAFSLGRRMRGKGALTRDEASQRIQDALRSLGLARHAGRYPAELSGGERQRVAIARALVLQPRAILLDEPLASLDMVLRAELIDLFRSLFEKRQTTLLYVTHDLSEARRIATRLAVLDQGRILFTGPDLPEDSSDPFLSRLVELGGGPVTHRVNQG